MTQTPTELQWEVFKRHNDFESFRDISKELNLTYSFIGRSINLCSKAKKEASLKNYNCESCRWKSGSRPCVFPESMCFLRGV